jgi:hypothetical protein
MEVEAAGQIWRLEPWMRRGRGVSVAVARARVKSTAHHSQAKDGTSQFLPRTPAARATEWGVLTPGWAGLVERSIYYSVSR